MKTYLTILILFFASGSCFAASFDSYNVANIYDFSSRETYTKSGDTYYGSDGSKVTKSGNNIFITPSLPQPDYKPKTYCNTIHGRTYCNGVRQN